MLVDVGVVSSELKDRAQLEKILSEDPFSINGVTDYEIMEFTPVKFHVDFASFI